MGWFKTTLWTEIRAAGAGDTQASEAVVERYRPVIRRYLLKRGSNHADAEDLAQEVLLRLFTQGRLAGADATRGRFRSYLLGITRNVLHETRRRAQALKRGGGAAPLSLADLETEPPAEEGDEAAFDACWLEALMGRALEALRQRSSRQYDLLKFTLADQSIAEIAAATGRTANAVRVDMHRARKRLGEALTAEISTYTNSSTERAEELAWLTGHLGQAL